MTLGFVIPSHVPAQVLSTGQHPPRGVTDCPIEGVRLLNADKPIAGGKGRGQGKSYARPHVTPEGGRAFLVEYRGDWKYQRESFRLSAHWGATNICHQCNARSTGLLRTLCINFGV